MSSQPIEHLHPVLDFAHRLVSRLDSLADAPLMSMRPEDKRAALVTLARGRAQLDALALRLLADAERVEATVESGAGTAADWVAVETRQVRREARADLRLAENLEKHEVLAAAMAAGRVNVAQGRAIVASLERLPRTGQFAVSAEQRAAAETHLVELAAEHDAKALRVLGRRVFEVIAPDVAEEFEGRALEREEAEALRRTTLTMWEDDEGTCHGRFRLPALHGQMLTKMILAISSPSRAQAPVRERLRGCGIDPDLPTPVRHGIALTQLLESVQAKDLPRTGGCGATVVVSMTLDQLMAKLDTAGVCTLDTGGRISATEARRLACSAGIIPMVLGGRGQVLDVGRKRRLHTEAMRLAMGVRDGGCTAVDCEVPPGLCHAHHDNPWAEGGHTNVKTGRLICPHHHRRIHDPALPDQTPTRRQGQLPPTRVRGASINPAPGPVRSLRPPPCPTSDGAAQHVETTAPQQERADRSCHYPDQLHGLTQGQSAPLRPGRLSKPSPLIPLKTKPTTTNNARNPPTPFDHAGRAGHESTNEDRAVLHDAKECGPSRPTATNAASIRNPRLTRTALLSPLRRWTTAAPIMSRTRPTATRGPAQAPGRGRRGGSGLQHHFRMRHP